MSDELGSVDIAEPAEDGHTSEDAGDRFGVHAPDDTLGRPVGLCNQSERSAKTSTERTDEVLIVDGTTVLLCGFACSLA